MRSILLSWLRASWPAWAAGLICALLSLLPGWRTLDAQLFDGYTRLTAPRHSNLPITIVSIDEASMAAIGRQWPWPRRLHAQLLDNLQRAGVAVVAFDVLFAEPASDPADDLALEQSIRRSGSVVLAADIEYRETGNSRQWLRVDPLPRYLAAGAKAGLAAVELDRDGVLRRFPGSSQALWRQTALQLDRRIAGVVARPAAQPQQRIRYLGTAGTFDTIPYYQMLQPERYLPADWQNLLRDNIVLVGRSLKSTTQAGAAQADLFLTPFVAEGGQLMSGVEVHATLLANMIEGNTLRELPQSCSFGLLALSTLLAGMLLAGWRPVRSALLAAGLSAAVALLCGALFVNGWWLPAASALLAPPLAYIALGGRAFLLEQAQRRQIRREFEHYVAPEVVASLLAQPGQLKLGGQRSELTILFTDLAGFTSLAERLDSVEVAALLNRHLSDMTEIIIQHHGTVDKFIGDAVMAFWGAPLADERQTGHAFAAALAMQQAVAAMNEELRAEGKPPLTLRIGLHRGECVVGNMGGAKHFAYTAIGDSVNLASRLEGVNKYYGTTLLLSGEAVAALPEDAPLRPVDTIRVVGRQQQVAIYTPCFDREQRQATAAALAAYRAGDGAAAMQAWQALAATRPDDPLPTVFLARLQQWQHCGLPAGWDGVTTLESK